MDVMELRVNLYKSELIEGYVKRKASRVIRGDVKKIEIKCLREITGVYKKKGPTTRGAKFVCNVYNKSSNNSGSTFGSTTSCGGRRMSTSKCHPTTNKALIEKNLNDYLERCNILSCQKKILFTNNSRFTRLNGFDRDMSCNHTAHCTENSLMNLPYCVELDRRPIVVPTVKEIEQLTKVVADLRAQHSELITNKSSNDYSDEDVDVTNADLQSKLMKTVSVNDVLLTTTDGWVESIDKDTNTVIIHQTIKGCAGSIPFTLQLLVQQDRNDEGPLENTFVVDLDLDVHKNAQEELKPFIEKMRSCRDVMLCVKGLNDYAVWDNLRRKTFEHFRQLHPGLISIDGQELLIQNYNIRATVIWTVTTEETGHLTPHLSLKVQKTRQAALTDKDNLISRLSHIFQLMLQVFGVERSIATVIEMLDV